MKKKSAFKIAIIEPVGGHGGMDYYDYGLMHGLIVNGVDSNLYTCDKTIARLGFNNKTFNFFSGIYGSKSKYIRAIFYIFGLLKSIFHAKYKKCNICHFHFFHYTFVDCLSVIFAKIFNFVIVSTIHDVESFTRGSSNFLANIIFKHSDRMIVHNDTSYGCLARLVKDTNKIKIIPHGNYVPYIVEQRDSEDFKSILNLSLDSKIVLFFGQIKEVKGLDILIKAWGTYKRKSNNVKDKLIIAGKVWKDDWNKYESLINSENIGDSVILDINYIPNELAQKYYQSADIVVLPYKKIFQSGVLIMAMSYAKAIIASDIPGMLDLIKHKHNGYVFESENVDSLASAIGELLDNNLLREKISKDGYRYVNKHLDWIVIGRATTNLYRDII